MPTHVGLIGGGNISETHARAALATPDVAISAIFGTNMQNVERLARDYGGKAFTDYNAFLAHKPIDLVMTTARAAVKIRYPHQTWVLDDGARPEMRAAAHAEGIGYITRSEDWANMPCCTSTIINALDITRPSVARLFDRNEDGMAHLALDRL